MLERPQGYDPQGFEDFIYNGEPASAKPVFRTLKHASRWLYEKERGERNQLVTGLLLQDDTIPATVTKRSNNDPPDFDVVLVDGRCVFVEVTEGTTTHESYLNKTVGYLRAAFSE